VAVTVVQPADRLVNPKEPRVSELAHGHLRATGVDLRTGTSPRRARRDGRGVVVELDDGSEVAADVIVFGTGRVPRTADLGLDNAGVRLSDRGAIIVDDHCQAAPGMWAIGDVTGIMAFTHVAKYQGRVAADTILGKSRSSRYQGVPRVVFATPEIAAVGLTAEQARNQDLHTASAEVDLAASLARLWTYEREPRGHLGLLADTDREVLVGAWAVARKRGNGSIKLRSPFGPASRSLYCSTRWPSSPTYTEGYLAALEALPAS